jgi:hypothetical protein
MNDIVPICIAAMFFLVLPLIFFGFFALLRYIRYRETIAMIEKGIYVSRPEPNGKGTLIWGIVIASLGIALCIGLYPLGWLVAPGMFPLNFGPWMLLGLVPAAFGLALIVVYLLTSRKKETTPAPYQPLENDLQ